MTNTLAIRAEAEELILEVFGVIGFDLWGDAPNAAAFRAKIGAAKPTRVRLVIHSPGGSIADALAMHNIVRETGAEITSYIQGVAASAASYLAMAADSGRLEMPPNALMMLHKPLLATEGNADDLRRDAVTLDQFEEAMVPAYMRHFRGSKDELVATMTAETWFTAAECAERFGAVVAGEPFKAAAMLDFGGLARVPAAALAFGTVPPPPVVAAFTVEALAVHDAEVMARADGIYVPKLAEAVQKAAALAVRVAELEAAVADANDQAVKAKADAADTRQLLERVTGRGLFAGDSEGMDTVTWPQALATHAGDYVAARKSHPAAYEAYRRDCKARR